jgi:selenocysteine lyase/cysteine desulfurase
MTPDRRTVLGGMMAAAAPASAAPARRMIADVRRDFPIMANGRTFLNSAYITPIPDSVVAATQAFAEAKASRPLEVRELMGATERVRRQFADLINATPDEVGLLFSTAEGENVVASGLDLKAGDNVAIDDLHYDSEFVLYRRLEKTLGIELRIARNRGGAVDVRDFASLVDRKTRLVSVAWVSHRNGFRHDMRPIADLAHAHGALFYTDAIQAAGTIRIDVRAADVDFLCAGGYKWLLAGWGVAPFYIRKSLIPSLRLDRYGEFNASRELPDGDYEIDPTARRFDYSSRAFGECHALSAGLAYLQSVGVDRIEAHTVGLALDLQRELAKQGHRLATPAGNRSPIVAIETARPIEEVRGAFTAAKVDVTARGGRIRIAPALFNTPQDIEQCLRVTHGLRA